MYPLIYLHRMHHQSHLLYTNCPASFPLYWNREPIPPHFMTQWAYTPSFTYIVGTTFVIYCTQTLQPHLLPYLHSGPIPPHFMTQWAYTPHLLTKWAPPSSSTVHRLSSLTSSLACTVGHTSSFYDAVGIYPLVYLHNGYHPRHLLYTDSPASFPPLFAKYLLIL